MHQLVEINKKFPDVPNQINYQKMQAIAEEIWEVNLRFNSVRENFKDQQLTMNTDVGYQIITMNRKYDEDKLNKVYQKLKTLLV